MPRPGPEPATPAADPTSKPPDTNRFLLVTINSSTSNIVSGAVYGLDADFQNVSSVHIIVDINDIQLTVQPELAPPDISCTWFYDADANTSVTTSLDATTNKRINKPLTLQPIESHGGRLWAAASEGCGATFHFHLPCAAQAPTQSSRGATA
jgi:hypothetical protein